MNHEEQSRKARDFLALHHHPKLLVLPNIWDPLGARMLEALGYPAVATASAAVANSLGYADGQRIRFDTMLQVIARIASSVAVPVTADIERGYANDTDGVHANVSRVLEAGAVGINIEDSIEDSSVEGGALRDVRDQCRRIQAARRAADAAGIPLVINARIDVFLRRGSTPQADAVEETIARGRQYVEAGADCLYPITVGDVDKLQKIRAGTGAPINVYAMRSTAPMQELEAAGISRLSLGPGFLKASLTTLKQVATELLNYGSYDSFTQDVISSEEIGAYVAPEAES